MFPFKRKPELEEPEIKLGNLSLEALEDFNEATFRKIVQATTNTDELRARLSSMSKYLQKLPDKPLQRPEEKMQRRAKLHNLMRIISTEIHERDEETKKKAVAEAQRWVRETVPTILCDLRFNYTDAASLKNGIISLDVVRWEKPKGNVITAKLANNFSMDFDLTAIPHPILRTILSNPLRPVYFGLTGGALREGKPYHEKYQSKDFLEQTKIKPVPESYLALMRV